MVILGAPVKRWAGTVSKSVSSSGLAHLQGLSESILSALTFLFKGSYIFGKKLEVYRINECIQFLALLLGETVVFIQHGGPVNTYSYSYDGSVLGFSYTGNRMTGAADSVSQESFAFACDADGNRTSDGRTGLEFSYNILNLPCEVYDGQQNMRMRYTYLSDGTKVSAFDAAGHGLLYRGNFVYDKTGSTVNPESVAWDEGRIKNTVFLESHDDEPVDEHVYERAALFQDQWFVKDHLGNVRSVINLSASGNASADNVILEQNDYLTFGNKAVNGSQSSISSNRHRYAGKEEQRIGSFNSQLLDFGARSYDPWTCQWTAVDPMGEKYCRFSPYVYCAGNPIVLADPDGASPKDKRFAVGIGIVTNIIPNSGFLRDQYTPDDKADYNENLQKVDDVCSAVGISLVAKGVLDFSAGNAVAATGFAVVATGVGAAEGIGIVVEGGAVDATGLVEIAVGSTMAMNTAENAGKGYDRGGEGKIHGKNEKHGDGGRSISKIENRIKELEAKAETVAKKERQKINRTINNLKHNAQQKKSGEEHSRIQKH